MTDTTTYHISVMLLEVLEYLQPGPQKQFIDATLGGGGHTKALLDHGALVLGIDQDHDALNHVASRLNHPNLTTHQANFREISSVAETHGFTEVDGVLFDLGVSSHQFDEAERGFSFNKEAALDMRMDQNLSVTAADLLAALGPKELTKLFSTYGEEPRARKIAEVIVAERKRLPITTTMQLARLIEKVYRGQHSHLHPATKVFQALRIAVNDEINNLKEALPQAFSLLKPGGRMAVISFHGGEDRVVKQFIKQQESENIGKNLTPKPLVPSELEISQNIRSRSAKLRVIEKI